MAWEPADTPERQAAEKARRAKLYLLAGTLTLAGTALGQTLHPVFYALPASASTVLVVSGLFDRPATDP
jgi:hypothetical protein